MQHTHYYLCATLLAVSLASTVQAKDDLSVTASSDTPINEVAPDASSTTQVSRLESLKELKNVKANDLKVNANAAQPDSIKDPLEALNRETFAFNDFLDRNFARPVAVQYKTKVPDSVRGAYRSFRKNLNEPWNAVNQLVQGRPSRAAKSLGRFTINTVTTLGFADPARRLGLDMEEEGFGTTLGYYSVPSGPYLVLPIVGPSTFRDGIGFFVDGQARPQKYMFDNNDGIYWSDQLLRGIDTRAQILDVEDVLQGDRYAAIRDIYLQRKNFEIAQKQGLDADNISFVDEESDDGIDDTPDEDTSKPSE
ncbi:MlaA family lipoprotein [Acinetobacter tandoii]|uniref:Lipoprotein n=1 Tax=Acinetobacter tandoii DSM 14970 = CIP 107469 TaxID=1120927 RepID=R9B4E1_9GAMM|nr:VacJ family lipoprotein [Acinetobacter tandoii]EOR09287.1 lipoprotein [Acinetobacter tandoii DSM 14970 = CIP 107469]